VRPASAQPCIATTSVGPSSTDGAGYSNSYMLRSLSCMINLLLLPRSTHLMDKVFRVLLRANRGGCPTILGYRPPLMCQVDADSSKRWAKLWITMMTHQQNGKAIHRFLVSCCFTLVRSEKVSES